MRELDRLIAEVLQMVFAGIRMVPLLFFLACFHPLSAQNINEPTNGGGASKHAYQEGESREVPAGFPKFMDNGNPSEDNADYQKRKEAWIKANPEAYKKIIDGTKRPAVKHIPREEFDQMPQDKKNAILQNPDLYKVGSESIKPN